MKTMIKWLCFLYFFHHRTTGLVLYDEDFGGLKIKFEPKESEDKE